MNMQKQTISRVLLNTLRFDPPINFKNIDKLLNILHKPFCGSILCNPVCIVL